MVLVRQQPVRPDGSVDLSRWLDAAIERIHGNADDHARLQNACELAQRLAAEPWHSVTPPLAARAAAAPVADAAVDSFGIGLDMAQILSELRLDPPTLVAAVLYRPVREGKLALAAVEQDFGKPVARLLEGVLRMAAIGSLRKTSEATALGQNPYTQIDHVRKMLLAMIDDVRVALIKIAERTCAIRAVKNADPERKRRIAREVKDIYAPLAHRLGLGQLRWELEDLSFRYLDPQAYQEIARLLDERRVDRQKYIEEVVALLQQELDTDGINAQIKGRAKHIYSIWRKMREKGVPFSQVYDVRAVRILVDTVHECYMVLGIVHGLWHAIPNQFDDYIANPKQNGYRSLHTAVIGPHGKVMEVQIRTHWMDEEAEFGVCAHWQYKDENGVGRRAVSADYEQKIEWLRQVLEWHEETGGDRDLIEELRSDVIHQKIYVFTPDGDAVEIQRGATALDFAYHVHSGLGHRCRGARVNGKLVPLNYSLKNSDQVEIITGKHEIPNREWLSESLGYVTTARARSKIQQWFRQQDRERHVVDGSLMLDREFHRLALHELDLEQLARRLNFAKTEDLYVAVGASDIDMNAVLSVAQQMERISPVAEQLSFMPETPARRPELQVVGVGNMPVETAACCEPQKRDAIGGIIHPANGEAAPFVVVHRQDCEQFLQMQGDEPQRVLRVAWYDARRHAARTLEADLELHAYERTGLLRDITQWFDEEGGNILKLSSVTDKAANTVAMTFTIEIANLQKLSALLSRLSQVPNIFSVRRVK